MQIEQKCFDFIHVVLEYHLLKKQQLELFLENIPNVIHYKRQTDVIILSYIKKIYNFNIKLGLNLDNNLEFLYINMFKS